jgi:hypothetical protein
MNSNHGGIYKVGGQNLNFLGFFGAIAVKTFSFSVQTVEFVFKQSNFNLNGSITSHHILPSIGPNDRQ